MFRLLKQKTLCGSSATRRRYGTVLLCEEPCKLLPGRVAIRRPFGTGLLFPISFICSHFCCRLWGSACSAMMNTTCRAHRGAQRAETNKGNIAPFASTTIKWEGDGDTTISLPLYGRGCEYRNISLLFISYSISFKSPSPVR